MKYNLIRSGMLHQHQFFPNIEMQISSLFSMILMRMKWKWERARSVFTLLLVRLLMLYVVSGTKKMSYHNERCIDIMNVSITDATDLVLVNNLRSQLAAKDTQMEILKTTNNVRIMIGMFMLFCRIRLSRLTYYMFG